MAGSASPIITGLWRESGVPFQDDIAAHEVTAPASLKSPRECLARGLLKRRARHGAYVYAPERLRPSTVEHVLAQIEPYRISLATPQTVRDAVRGHFAKASPPRRSTDCMRATRSEARERSSRYGSACRFASSRSPSPRRLLSRRGGHCARALLRSLSSSCRHRASCVRRLCALPCRRRR